jgi:hypothetical protein
MGMNWILDISTLAQMPNIIWASTFIHSKTSENISEE